MTSILFRLAVPIVIAAAAGFAGYYHGFKHAESKGRAELALYREDAAKRYAEAVDQARAKEAQWAAKLKESQDEARKREARLRADLDRVRSESFWLRDSVATAGARLRLPNADASAVAQYADTAGALLLECSEAYRKLAEASDGHAADALMLHQAWPGP